MRLDPNALARFLAGAPDWTFSPERGGLISRTLVFADFEEAFAFMAQVALVAARMDHHPEWSNAYNRVDVVLTTHDATGLSTRDVELSRHMDRIYRPRHAAAAAAD
jgi:4a-hydroxytetrahydrobiopterin dehydratase